MKLFCFASRSCENVLIGHRSKKWAVATTSDKDQISRRTKARKNVRIGDYGILYCNPLHAFTVPFVIESEPDFDRIITDIWPESWVLPFDIRPLCGPERNVPAVEAEQRWSAVKKRYAEMGSRTGGISAAMHITGTTVFVPVHISYREWTEILGDFQVAL